jgi:cation diffusion facilitator family transporter
MPEEPVVPVSNSLIHAHADFQHCHHHHPHAHGVVDPVLATSTRGLDALKLSFLVLGLAALIELGVVLVSGSMGLLADMIHNTADACTAIPLAIAFILSRRAPTDRFTYGYGRVEDLAGVAIVLVILASALAIAYEAVQRIVSPEPIGALGAVAVAGIVGFIANEAAAQIRTRTGNEIHSAALTADGHHARVDGFASLAVAAGAGAAKLGYPIVDPIVALAITILIFALVFESARTVFMRMLDGVESGVVAEIRHVAAHVEGIGNVGDVRARWIGHRLYANASINVDGTLSVDEAAKLIGQFRDEASYYLPQLSDLHVSVDSDHRSAR